MHAHLHPTHAESPDNWKPAQANTTKISGRKPWDTNIIGYCHFYRQAATSCYSNFLNYSDSEKRTSKRDTEFRYQYWLDTSTKPHSENIGSKTRLTFSFCSVARKFASMRVNMSLSRGNLWKLESSRMALSAPFTRATCSLSVLHNSTKIEKWELQKLSPPVSDRRRIKFLTKQCVNPNVTFNGFIAKHGMSLVWAFSFFYLEAKQAKNRILQQNDDRRWCFVLL